MNSGQKYGSEDIGAELRTYIDAFRDSAREQAARPGWFWASQRAHIRSRLSERAGSMLAVFASLAAVLVVAFAMLFSGPNLQSPAAQVARTSVDDDALMAQVVDATDTSGPDVLAPADILAQELDNGLKSAMAGGKGEAR